MITLDSSHIGDEGAGRLADAIKMNQTLQEISLDSRHIGDEGAGRLANFIKVIKHFS